MHVSRTHATHSQRTEAKDLQRILQTIQTNKVFQSQTSCQHESFPQIRDSLTANVKIKTLKEWITDHLPQSIKNMV